MRKGLSRLGRIALGKEHLRECQAPGKRLVKRQLARRVRREGKEVVRRAIEA